MLFNGMGIYIYYYLCYLMEWEYIFGILLLFKEILIKMVLYDGILLLFK